MSRSLSSQSTAGLATEYLFRWAGIARPPAPPSGARPPRMCGAGVIPPSSASSRWPPSPACTGCTATGTGSAPVAPKTRCAACRLQVAHAPATARFDGTAYHFCSDHCQQRFSAAAGGCPGVGSGGRRMPTPYGPSSPPRRPCQRGSGAVRMMCRPRLPGMAGCGAVINIASPLAFSGSLPPGPLPFLATYAAAKAYLVTFSCALAGELSGTGLRVLACCPGPVATEFLRGTGIDPARLPIPRWTRARWSPPPSPHWTWAKRSASRAGGPWRRRALPHHRTPDPAGQRTGPGQPLPGRNTVKNR